MKLYLSITYRISEDIFFKFLLHLKFLMQSPLDLLYELLGVDCWHSGSSKVPADPSPSLNEDLHM